MSLSWARLIRSMSLIQLLKHPYQYFAPSNPRSSSRLVCPQVFSPKPRKHLSSSLQCYLPHPFHTSWLDHPNNIGWRVGTIKILFVQSFPLPCGLCYDAVKSNAFTKLRKCMHNTTVPSCGNFENIAIAYNGFWTISGQVNMWHHNGLKSESKRNCTSTSLSWDCPQFISSRRLPSAPSVERSAHFRKPPKLSTTVVMKCHVLFRLLRYT